jgi:RNA polymerase sigma-32 factor
MVNRIAEQLKVSEEEVVNMNRRLSTPDHSLNARVRDETEDEWQDWLVDEEDDQEKRLGDGEELNNRRQMLVRAMKGLSERERLILGERRLKDAPSTLQNLSERYGISRERVRQIEVRAFEKVQRSVKNAVIAQQAAY